MIRMIWSFLYCTLTGLGLGLLILGLGLLIFVAVVCPIVYGLYKFDSAGALVKKIGERVATVVISVLVAGFVTVTIMGAHDWGCDIHHHPEHKIFKDKK